MLHYITIVLLSLSFGLTDGPHMQFKKAEKNFGKVKEGRIINLMYEFENTGDDPLIIKEIQASCGCTVAAYPTFPIKPGEKDFITVKFISLGKVGYQEKQIKVICNDPRGEIKLKLTGEVLRR